MTSRGAYVVRILITCDQTHVIVCDVNGRLQTLVQSDSVASDAVVQALIHLMTSNQNFRTSVEINVMH